MTIPCYIYRAVRDAGESVRYSDGVVKAAKAAGPTLIVCEPCDVQHDEWFDALPAQERQRLEAKALGQLTRAGHP